MRLAPKGPKFLKSQISLTPDQVLTRTTQKENQKVNSYLFTGGYAVEAMGLEPTTS